MQRRIAAVLQLLHALSHCCTSVLSKASMYVDTNQLWLTAVVVSLIPKAIRDTRDVWTRTRKLTSSIKKLSKNIRFCRDTKFSKKRKTIKNVFTWNRLRELCLGTLHLQFPQTRIDNNRSYLFTCNIVK